MAKRAFPPEKHVALSASAPQTTVPSPGAPPERQPAPAPAPLPGAILFACTLNAVRSPMAAAIFGHLAGRRSYVVSAGVKPGDPDPFAATVMKEIGLDISKHQPRSIEDLHDTSFDLVITLTPEAHHQALELTRTMAVDVEYWPTLDPTIIEGSREQVLNAYRECRDGLLRRIKARFAFPPPPQV